MTYMRYESPKRRLPVFKFGITLVVAVLLAAVLLHFHKKPATGTSTAVSSAYSAKLSNQNLDWPDSGEAAVGVVGSGVLAVHGTQTARPTASTAKLITALAVLKKYPLQPGQSGPTLTMSRTDIDFLVSYTALDGSEIGKVFVGEKLTEYQMLEAMMLPSANNMADSLAVWAYGSLPEYATAANSYLASQGLHDTHVGTDASGLDPSTVTTAHDLVLLGELAMQNPVLAEIVGKQSVDGFPLVGTIENTNTLLGHDGIVGVKTGNTDEAGGVFVFAAKHTGANGSELTIVGAVQGLPNLQAALDATQPLLRSAKQNIE